MSMETDGLPKLDNVIFGEIQLPLLLPLMLLNLGLVVLGTWLVFRSIRRIRHFEHRVKELSEKYRSLAEFIE